MSAGQVDNRRWRASWQVVGGVYRTQEYSASDLRWRFGWDNWCEQLERIRQQAVGERYTDYTGWTWERVA